MNEQTILARYTALLKAYARQPDDKLLAAAAELSREMVQADMSLEAVSRIYVEALQRLAQERPDMTLPDTLGLVLPFLQQLMTASGLAHASKQMVESLQQSAAEYRAIFETTGTAMMIIEEDTTISLLNTEGEKLYGYPREKVEGKRSWTEFVVPDDLERMKEYHRLRRSDPSQAPQNYEFRLMDRRGKIKNVLLFIDMIPGTRKSVVSLLDITQRKRAEKALKRRVTQLTTVAKIGRQIASLRALDPLLDQVGALIREAFGYRYVSLFLVDPARKELTLRAGAGYEIEPAQAIHLKIGAEGICGWVAASGEPLLAGDVLQEPRYYPLDTLADTRSELALPVRLKDQIIGVLDVQSDALNAFDAEDTFVLQLLSDQVAVALENTRLFEAEQRRRQEAETLQEAALTLTTTLERDEVVKRILIQLREVVPYDSASVQLLQDDQLEIIGGHGFPNPEKVLGITFDLAAEDIPNVKVMDSRAPLILKDAPADYDRFEQESRARHIHGWLGVPLLVGDRVVGMLALDKHEPGFYTEEHAQLALAFAAQAAIAIENARLYAQAQQEIAERQRAEEEVRTSEAQKSSLLETIPHAVIGLQERRIVFANPGVETVFGWKPEELLGKTTRQLYRSQEEYEEIGKRFYPKLEKQLSHREEFTCRHKDGRDITCMVSASRIGASLQDKKIVVVYEDITERAQMEKSLREATDTLAAQNTRLAALQRVGQMLNSTLDVDAILEYLVDEALRVTPATHGQVLVARKESGYFERRSLRGFSPQETELARTVLLALDKGINGRVYATGQTIRVDDARDESDYFPLIPATRAELGVPIVHEGEVLGNLDLQSPTVGAFRDADLEYLQALADQAAIAIENARLFQAEQEQRELAEALAEASAAVGSTLDLDEVFARILEQAARVVPGDVFNIMLLEGDTVRAVRWQGYKRLGIEEQITSFTVPFARYPNFIKMVESGKTVFVPDTTAAPDWVMEAGQEWRRSYIGAPIQAEGVTIGFLNADGTRAGQFCPADAQRLEAFAGHAAIAIQNARLYQQSQELVTRIKRRGEDLGALREISLAISDQLELDKLLQSILKQGCRLLDVRAGGIYLVDEAKGDLKLVVSHGLTRDYTGLRLAPGEGICGKVLQSGEPLIVDDYHHWEGRSPSWEAEPITANISVPFKHGERIIGVMGFIELSSARKFDEYDVRLAALFADQAAIAIENARLYQQSQELTARLTRLYELSLQINETLSLEEALELVARQVIKATAAHSAVINLLDQEGHLEFHLGIGADGELQKNISPPRSSGTTMSIYRTGAPLIANDLEGDDPLLHPSLRKKGIKAFIGLPLKTRERCTGVLFVRYAESHSFSEEEVQALSLFANQAAVALENARLYHAEQLSRERADTLREISRVVGSTLELDEVLSLVLRQAKRVLTYDSASILLFADDQPAMAAVIGYEDEEIVKTEVALCLDDSPILQSMACDHQPVLIADVREDERWIWVPGAEGVRAWIGAPLLVRDEMIGTLMIDSTQPGLYTAADVAIAQTLANQAAVAIENARLYTSLDQEKARLELLYRLSHQLSESLDVHDVAQRALDELCTVVGAMRGIALVRELDSERLQLVAVSGYATESLATLSQRMELGVGSSLIGRVVARRQPELVADVLQDKHWVPVPGLDDGVRSALSVPLFSGDETIGAFSIYSDREAFFNDDHRRLAESVAATVAVAIQNARLYEQAQHRLESLSNLNRASQALTSSLEVQEVLGQIVDLTSSVVNSDYTSVALLDEKGQLTLGIEDFRGVRPLSRRLRAAGVTRRVLESGQPVLMDEISADGTVSPPLRRPDGELLQANPDIVAAGIRSAVAVPIQIKGKTLGVLFVHSRMPRAFRGQLTLLSTFANQAAVALENARLYEQARQEIVERERAQAALRRRATQLATLGEVGQQLAFLLPRDPLLERIVNLVREAFAYRYVVILLVDPPTQTLELKAGAGFEVERLKPLGLKIGAEGICGWVAASGESLLVNDVSQEPRYYLLEPLPDTRSELAVPIRVQDQVVGVLDVQSTELNAFDQADLFTLRTLANQAAVAIENARLFEAEQQQRREAETLREAALTLTTTLERSQVIERILIQLREVVPYDSSSVQLLRDNQLEIIGGHGFPNLEELLGVTFDLTAEDNPNREVVHTQAPLILEDAPTVYNRFTSEPHRQADIHSWLGVPMLIGDQPIGIITLDKQEPGFYTEEHARLAEAFAAQAAVAIENARLYEQAQQQARDLGLLYEIGRLLASSLEITKMLDQVSQRCTEVFDADLTLVRLIADDLLVTKGSYFRDPADRKTVEELLATYPLHVGEGIVGRVAASGQPAIHRAKEDVSRLTAPGYVAYLRTREWILVPMRSGKAIIGVLTLIRRNEKGPFLERDMTLAQGIADQAAVAIENARLYEETKRHVQELTVLHNVDIAITSTLNLDEVLDLIVRQAAELLGAETMVIPLLSEDGTSMTYTAAYGRLAADLVGQVKPLNKEGICTWVLRNKQAFYSPDLAADEREGSAIKKALGLRTVISAPMISKGKIIGAITAINKQDGGVFTHADLEERLRPLANQAAVAIENARLYAAEREQRELSESLVEAAVAVGSTLELDEVLDRLLEQVERVVPGDACNVMLIEEDVARAVRWRGYQQLGSEEFVSTVTFPLAEVSNLQQMVETGKPVLISDTATYPGWVQMPAQAWLRSYVSTPIQVGRVTVGFLNVDSTRPGQFDSADARRLEAFAHHAAIAIENAGLYRQLRRHAEQLEERVQERTAQLQAQYARLDALLRSVSDGILVTDAQGNLIQTNPIAQRWLTQTLSAGDAERLQTLVRNLARRAQKRPEEVLELPGLDLQLNAAPIAEREAEEATVVVVAHDVSHIKALERMKSRFVTNVSHELRTPITTIKLYAALLQQKPEKWEQYLDALAQEAEHLARLVEDVLQVSRIDNGRLEIHPRPTSLNTFTELIVSSHQVLAQSSGVTLSYQPAAPDPLALADPDQLTQALNNLVRNALHYTPEGGEVNVFTGTAERKGRLWATVTVADTGIGIPQEELPHIFERFFRGQQPRSLQLSGSGLGLSIVHEIVEQHGGRVTVDSKVGVGSTFTIWLPLLKE